MTTPHQERCDVLLSLSEALALLEASMDIRLIPPSGSNIAYAVSGARVGQDVAAVMGGIVIREKKAHAQGPCAFDAGGHISRIVLTAMKFDPVMRSAIVIAFRPDLLDVLEDMFIECCTFNPEKEPPGINTMDWGVASCCQDGVPEVIYDCGTGSKGGLIRLIGENPVEIAGNIIILSDRIQ
jgi:hydroxymethylpyrimidine/phosphomethylpyrimidine kinase